MKKLLICFLILTSQSLFAATMGTNTDKNCNAIAGLSPAEQAALEEVEQFDKSYVPAQPTQTGVAGL